jgi:hypothetical protein
MNYLIINDYYYNIFSRWEHDRLGCINKAALKYIGSQE